MNPSLYFIGDSPLGFEPEIASLFLKNIASTQNEMPQYVGLVGLRRVLWATLHEADEPALFKMHQDRVTFSDAEWSERAHDNPFYFVDRHYSESEVIWRRGVQPWLECTIDRGLSTLLEGVGVLPQFLASLELPHKAVFVGTTQPVTAGYKVHVEEIRRSSRDHWMRQWSDEKIEAYLTFILPAYGTRLKELCQKHDYQFFDYADADDYTTIQHQAADYLARNN